MIEHLEHDLSCPITDDQPYLR